MLHNHSLARTHLGACIRFLSLSLYLPSLSLSLSLSLINSKYFFNKYHIYFTKEFYLYRAVDKIV